MKFDKVEALVKLQPNAEFTVKDDVIEWLSDDITQPTDAEIQAKIDEMVAEYDAQEYARNRKVEYPSIGDQLDALFHAGVFPEDMTATIQAVKDAHPKPEDAE